MALSDATHRALVCMSVLGTDDTQVAWAECDACAQQRSGLCMTVSFVLQAIKLLGQLSSRLPDIVHLLQPNFDDSAVIIIRQGFAAVCKVTVTSLRSLVRLCAHLQAR
jgi:hypothetical protein